MLDLSQINISGDLHDDLQTRERFSFDANSCRILPSLVVEPKTEQDILNIARNEGLSITTRSGGSGLCGAAIGPGIILNFKKFFNRVITIDSFVSSFPHMVSGLINKISEREQEGIFFVQGNVIALIKSTEKL